MPTSSGDFHRIIPTARMMAYLRSFSDIPYAKETSDALKGEEAAALIYQDDLDIATRCVAPLAEARYKCFDRFLSSERAVLELAVGTSVERGLCFSDDPDRMYIGTDLPEMIDETKTLCEQLATRKSRPNLHLEAVNVLSCEELNAAARHFDTSMEVAIINEGLLQYFTRDELSICAENVRGLLERYRGKWLTPDVIDSESNAQMISALGPGFVALASRSIRRIATLTGRDVEKNYFASRNAAISFFQKLGFKVSQYPMASTLASVTSIARLWGECGQGLYEAALKEQQVWVMSLS